MFSHAPAGAARLVENGNTTTDRDPLAGAGEASRGGLGDDAEERVCFVYDHLRDILTARWQGYIDCLVMKGK